MRNKIRETIVADASRWSGQRATYETTLPSGRTVQFHAEGAPRPIVNWPGMGPTDAEDALEFAEVLNHVVRLAERLDGKRIAGPAGTPRKKVTR
jgi:hypothetical protein